MSEIIVPIKVLLETPIATLYNDTERGFDTPRKQSAGRVQVVKMVFLAYPNQNAVAVGATTRSSAKQYETKIYFDDVTFLGEEDDQTGSVSFKTADGQEYFIEPISYTGTDAKVRCSCLDFHYRFSVWNDAEGSLLGKSPEPYIKVTDRPPVNPDRIAGLCKHLMKLAEKLKQERILM